MNHPEHVIKKNFIDMFADGARKGWTVATTGQLPYVTLAFIFIFILDKSGLLKLVGDTAAPVMALWNLPGEGLVVLLASLMAMGGGVGVAVGLIATGSLSPSDVSILAPGVYLMGSLFQYLGRCLGTAGANPRYWGWHMLISIFNAMVGMWLVGLFLLFV